MNRHVISPGTKPFRTRTALSAALAAVALAGTLAACGAGTTTPGHPVAAPPLPSAAAPAPAGVDVGQVWDEMQSGSWMWPVIREDICDGVPFLSPADPVEPNGVRWFGLANYRSSDARQVRLDLWGFDSGDTVKTIMAQAPSHGLDVRAWLDGNTAQAKANSPACQGR